VLASKHAVTNVQAHREDGGLVRAVAYFTATMFEPDRTRLVFGEYADSLCEVDGALRLVHKRIRVERLVDLPASSADWPGATPVLDGSVKE
jgi:3-phenylpropionate/cinnamic acid dioxygenase small subunit